MRFTRTFPGLLGASILLGACGTAISNAKGTGDSGASPACPPGPTGPTDPESALPAGACPENAAPCDYEATPCPGVMNGAVNGYQCSCVSGAWNCQIVNTVGMCSAISFDGGGDADLFPDVFYDASPIGPTGATGATGPTGPLHP